MKPHFLMNRTEDGLSRQSLVEPGDKDNMMQNYVGITRKEIQELTETILNNYFKATKTIYIGQIDIADLASFLNLTILYVNINEDDKNKVAFFSDGVRPVKIIENGACQERIFPKNTILIDNYLRQPDLETKRRYSISHEIGHYLLSRYGFAPVEAAFSCSFDKEKEYTYKELYEMMRLSEAQANEVGAFLLMPSFLVKRYIQEQFHSEKVPIFGQYMMRQDTKVRIKKIAEDLGVSFGALIIQIKQMHLIDYHSAEEFILEA